MVSGCKGKQTDIKRKLGDIVLDAIVHIWKEIYLILFQFAVL
jgi:hypothetical protein